MEVTDKHLVIRVPKLAGYKTLFVNAVIAVIALGVAIWPELPGGGLTPEDVGVWYEQVAAMIAAGVAAVNMVLRLMSSGPAAPFKRGGGGDRHEDGWPSEGERTAYEEGFQAGMGEANRMHLEARIHERYGLAKQTVAQALDNERIAGSDVLTDYWPPLADVKRYLVADEMHVEQGVCAWPDCPCHIRCKDRQDGLPLNGEAAEKLSFMQTLQTGAGVRALAAGFLSPVAVLFMGAALFLGGCAGHQAVQDGGKALEWHCGGALPCIDALRRNKDGGRM